MDFEIINKISMWIFNFENLHGWVLNEKSLPYIFNFLQKNHLLSAYAWSHCQKVSYQRHLKFRNHLSCTRFLLINIEQSSSELIAFSERIAFSIISPNQKFLPLVICIFELSFKNTEFIIRPCLLSAKKIKF